MIAIPMQVSTSVQDVPVSVSSRDVGLNIGIGAAYHMGRDAPYEGPYTFTPTNETQVVLTASKALSENLVINPIPSNYGLVTYNGATITIS